MESKHTISHNAYPDLKDESQLLESTNPFAHRNVRTDSQQQSSDTEASSKSGKRPRIQKPVYSVRLW